MVSRVSMGAVFWYMVCWFCLFGQNTEFVRLHLVSIARGCRLCRSLDDVGDRSSQRSTPLNSRGHRFGGFTTLRILTSVGQAAFGAHFQVHGIGHKFRGGSMQNQFQELPKAEMFLFLSVTIFQASDLHRLYVNEMQGAARCSTSLLTTSKGPLPSGVAMLSRFPIRSN